MGLTSFTEEDFNFKNHISEILNPYESLKHNNVYEKSEEILDISSSPSIKTIDSENFSQTDDDSEIFDPSPFDKLKHERNGTSWGYKKKSVSYRRKGGKSNRKLKSVQAKFKHARSKHDLYRWRRQLKYVDDRTQNWQKIQNYAFKIWLTEVYSSTTRNTSLFIVDILYKSRFQ